MPLRGADPIALVDWDLAYIECNSPLITESVNAVVNDDSVDKYFYGHSSYLGSIEFERIFTPWNLCSSTGTPGQYFKRRHVY